MKKKMSIKVKVILSIVIIFALYNVFWVGFTYARWNTFCKDLDYTGDGIFSGEEGVFGEKGRYVYAVSLPKYLSYGGNVSISRSEVRNEGIPGVSVQVFPEVDGYEVRVSIRKLVMDESGVNGMTQTIGSVILDENMEFYNEPSENDKKIFEEYRDDIKEVYDKMEEKWGIK